MSHNKHRYHACVWLVGAVLACANGGVAAQSLESGVFIGVSNLDYGGDMSILALGYDTSSGGLAAAELAATSFSGDSGAGFPETMIFSGGGSAFVVEPGQRPGLHVEAHGSLLNTFYNSENTPYFDATVEPYIVDESGVPDYFYAGGIAKQFDILAYTGIGTQYGSRYIFRVHGHVQGDGLRRGFLSIQIGSNPPELAFFDPNLPDGEVVASFATQTYPIVDGMSHEMRATLLAAFEVNTQSVAEGLDITGSSDFSNTITLDHIDVVDANNTLVSGWTVTAASGLDYDLPILRSDFDSFGDPVVNAENAIAPNAAELCAGFRGVQLSASKVLRRTSLCDQPIGTIREIKFRQVGASETLTHD